MHENTTCFSFINYFNTYSLVYWTISGATLISNLTRNIYYQLPVRRKRQLPNYIFNQNKMLLHIIIPTSPKTKNENFVLFLWKLMKVQFFVLIPFYYLVSYVSSQGFHMPGIVPIILNSYFFCVYNFLECISQYKTWHNMHLHSSLSFTFHPIIHSCFLLKIW